MGQEPAAPAEGQEPQAAEPKDTPDTQPSASGEPTTFSPEYVKELRSEAARHRKEAQEAKAKAAEYEDRDKSELEKITGKLTKAEERAQAAENTLLRFQVAAEKQLPKELIPRLRRRSLRLTPTSCSTSSRAGTTTTSRTSTAGPVSPHPSPRPPRSSTTKPSSG
jgi:hypothetical protein